MGGKSEEVVEDEQAAGDEGAGTAKKEDEAEGGAEGEEMVGMRKREAKGWEKEREEKGGQISSHSSKAVATSLRRHREEEKAKRTIGQVLLVRKHQQQALLHLAIVENLVQLGPRLVDTLPVLRVDDEDETLCTGVVVTPQGSNLVLSSDVLRGKKEGGGRKGRDGRSRDRDE
jgi:hypothetical protein